MATFAHTLDVLIVGAGQAGLALGYHLRTTPLRFQLVDRYGRVGDSWRRRYDSLVLFTPRAYSGLPGLPVPGDPDSYPTKDEIADYLERYAVEFDLPTRMGPVSADSSAATEASARGRTPGRSSLPGRRCWRRGGSAARDPGRRAAVRAGRADLSSP
jgi:cation diffusion facilitator CzcD-associated flavoprotein CzcO